MRERGSKLVQLGGLAAARGRSPCGSVDRNILAGLLRAALVAPRAGAWIETNSCLHAQACLVVAPRAGAWIETSSRWQRLLAASRSPCGSVDRNQSSPALRMICSSRSPCGSVDRNFVIHDVKSAARVAPRAGAWIETSPTMRLAARRRSPCGSVDRNTCGSSERLLWHLVAPRAGAWIETFSGEGVLRVQGRSPCGSVDRNPTPRGCGARRPCRSPCGSVDRNRHGPAVNWW